MSPSDFNAGFRDGENDPKVVLASIFRAGALVKRLAIKRGEESRSERALASSGSAKDGLERQAMTGGKDRLTG